jgi:glycosyltransferase involved in cell wall biosynthesis
VTLRVAFVYPNTRAGLIAAIADGSAPDTALLGQNHLWEHGIDADVHEPAVRHRNPHGGLVHRVTWHLRELALPLELGAYDVMCTPLANLGPLVSRVRRRPRVVLFNYGLSTVYSRSSRLRRRLVAAAARSAGAVVCLGESQRRRLRDLIRLDERRAVVVPLGVDADFHRATPVPADGHVLAVGRDLARDYRTFAEAARRWQRPTVVVTEARNLVDVTLPANVVVRRGLSYSELRDLYEGARCVVLPLRQEGYPYGTDGGGLTALVETMASARPVVASERPIMRDYVEPGSTGLLVPPEDADALADAVTVLLEDDELASRLAAGARARVEERHTTRRFAAELAKLLRETAAADR